MAETSTSAPSSINSQAGAVIGSSSKHAKRNMHLDGKVVQRQRGVVLQTRHEQRRQSRAWCNLPACWETVWGQQTGRVGDISTSGCLVRTTQKAAAVGDVLRIEIDLAEGVRVSAWGTVVHRATGTFGLQFKTLARLSGLQSPLSCAGKAVCR